MKTTYFHTYTAGWQQGQSADVSPAAKPPKTLGQSLKRAWQKLLAWITNPGDEPHIWTSHNRHGDLRWHGYDPLTGHRLYAATENEVLVWLENRYNDQ
jgi:hypothetical protein